MTMSTNGTLLRVPLDALEVDTTTNVRYYDDQLEDHTEEIKTSIIENGFFLHKPLSGYLGPNDVIRISGGFTRFEAACRARDEGYPIDAVPVILQPPETTDIDRIVALALDNTGKALRPYERGLVVKRLFDRGVTEIEISRRLGMTQSYANQLLFLMRLPAELQQLVADDKIPMMHVVTKARELGAARALAVLQDATAKPAPGRLARRLGIPTVRQALTAIDRALELDDGLDWLIAWRRGDHTPVAEVHTIMKARRKRTQVVARAS
jgi:hypothetical protein